MPRKFAVSLSDGTERVVEANSPEEAAAMVSNEAPSAGEGALQGAEAISETPAFEQGIPLSSLIGPTGGETRLPVSPRAITEAVPAGLSALGGFLGNVPGAALGGSVGEIIRQIIRKSQGYAPATGMIQEAAGMDPQGLPASLTGVATEAAGAAVPDFLSGLAATKGAPALRESGLGMYAGLLEPKGSTRALEQIKERIRPIAEELPAGFRGGIERTAVKKAEGAGQQVAKVYSKPTPASYDSAIEQLRGVAAKEERTSLTELPVYDDFGNLVDTVKIPPDVADPAIHKAMQGRIQDLQKATERREMAGGTVTLEDLFKQRKKESELARRSAVKTYKPGLKTQEIPPKARAHKAAQSAISDEMKNLTGGETGEGAVADAIHTAWKTVETGAKQSDPGTFISRWFLARTLPVGGTAGGAVAANPAFWRSVGAKSMRKLANLIELGQDVEAEHLVRGWIQSQGQEKAEP